MGRKSTRALWAAKLAGGQTLKVSNDAFSERDVAHFSGTILGIDPSLRGTGLAVISFSRPDKGVLLYSETVKVRRAFTMVQCLGKIATAIETILKKHSIDCAVIEQTIYVQNFQTAQVLGAARGAAVAPIAMRDILVYEYAPLRIKQSVVGFGRASKEQVAGMMQSFLNLEKSLPSDESDAAAAAFCHALTWKG